MYNYIKVEIFFMALIPITFELKVKLKSFPVNFNIFCGGNKQL